MPGVKEIIHHMLYEWWVQKTLVLMAMLYLNIHIGDINHPQGYVRKDQSNLDLKPLLLVFFLISRDDCPSTEARLISLLSLRGIFLRSP